MSGDAKELTGPDLAAGVPIEQLADGALLLGHAAGEAVLLARRGDQLFAIGATCTHYGGPLAEGLMVGDTVRCPWHHACFSLRTGEALRAPALNPVACYAVTREDGRIRVGERSERDPLAPVSARMPATAPSSVVIIGAGAAGNAAAEMLRREGYGGGIVMLDEEQASPYDRPNLSKDYLAGSAPEEWIPLRPAGFHAEHGNELVHGVRVTGIDVAGRQVLLASGAPRPWGALILATGARPVKLAAPGADRPHVHYLRSLADSRAIIAKATGAKNAVVIGASFIGLETAAALRARGLEVRVAAPNSLPLDRVLGPQMGMLVKRVHEEHGVRFHLEQEVASIKPDAVVLKGSEVLRADLVVIGIGVRPATELAEQAGLAMDRGVTVDAHLQTSVPGIYAVGDIARWPDRRTGQRIRVEHWVVAERMGQTAARNILGRGERFDAVPFFWSQHYDMTINYVGHAEGWDRIDVDGSIERRDCAVTYRLNGKALAVATIGRDRASLEAEAGMEG